MQLVANAVGSRCHVFLLFRVVLLMTKRLLRTRLLNKWETLLLYAAYFDTGLAFANLSLCAVSRTASSRVVFSHESHDICDKTHKPKPRQHSSKPKTCSLENDYKTGNSFGFGTSQFVFRRPRPRLQNSKVHSPQLVRGAGLREHRHREN